MAASPLVVACMVVSSGKGIAQQVAAGTRTDAVARATDEIMARRVTVRVDGEPLKRAIAKVALSGGVRVSYSQELVDTYMAPVSVRANNTPLATVFAQLLAGTKLMVVGVPGGRLAIVSVGTTADATRQGVGTIAGRVVDSATGVGIARATVALQGQGMSTLTSDDGKFLLSDVPAGEHVISGKMIGYRRTARQVTVEDGQHVTVQLALTSAPTVLSGVVTTATGVQQKREVGNDIVTLNVDSLKQVAPITSVTDLLESRVPGLTVLRASGAPGDPTRIRIRGSKSITGSNDPIVIVDGVRVYAAQSDQRTANLAGSAVTSQAAFAGVSYAAPSPLDQMDPNGIEMIEVLKGPSASSLYGSDAANGVIVITTKKGHAGPTHWNTTLAEGTSVLPGRYATHVTRYGHSPLGIQFTNSQPCDITRIAFCDVFDSVTHVQVLNQSRWSPFGRGSNTSGSATVSGGSAALTYALTGSAASDQGYLKLPTALAERFRQWHGYEAPGWAKRPSQYAIWGGSGQLTALPAQGVQLTFQSNLFHSRQQRSSLERQLPAFLSAVDTLCGTGFDIATCGTQTLAALNAYERVTNEQLTFTNALSGSWAPWAWLPLTATAGLSTSTGHDVALLARDIVPFVLASGCVSAGCIDTLGRYGATEKSATQKTLTVNTTVPGWRGRLKTALGLNVYSQSSSDLTAQTDTTGLPLGVSTPSALEGQATQLTTGTATYGWFFEPRLLLSERFFLTPGFRLDGGNANGSRAGAGALPGKLTFAALFPKVNFSWVALDRQAGEQPLFGVLTLLRPRLAIGSAGVQPGPGDQLRLASGVDLSSYGPAGANLLTLQALGNTQLRPERSTEMEGGGEAEFWRGRVTLNLTHARQLKRDAIIPITLAPSVVGDYSGILTTGVTLPATISVNIGEVRNTNTELSGSVRPVETPALTWSIGGSYYRNDTRVLKLDQSSVALLQGRDGLTRANTTTSVEIYNAKIAVGYPLFGRWAQPIVGYYDANQDGVIEANEITYGDTSVYLGRQEPAYTAALNTDLTLFRGRLGVHANVSRQGGYAQLNGAARDFGTFLSGANEPGAPFGEQALYVAAVSNPGSQYGLVQTVNSWRFQSLSVNYNAPVALARRFRSQRMSLALQGENLGLWTNYRGKDPNVNGYSNSNLTADLGQLPQPRTWRLQLTLGN